MAPASVARILLGCTIVFAAALFTPYWSSLDGPDAKYVGGTAGVYSIASERRSSSWSLLDIASLAVARTTLEKVPVRSQLGSIAGPSSISQ